MAAFGCSAADSRAVRGRSCGVHNPNNERKLEQYHGLMPTGIAHVCGEERGAKEKSAPFKPNHDEDQFPVTFSCQ